MKQSFYVKTYGCQMNDYDSEKVDELLIHNGYAKAENFEHSDIAILNTCHIRKKSSEKFYSDLGRLSVLRKIKKWLVKVYKLLLWGVWLRLKVRSGVLKRNKAVDYVVGPQKISTRSNLLKKSPIEKVHTNFLCEEI